MARRFATTMATRLDWILLTGLKAWPVPNPEAPGDWVAVGKDKQTAVLHHILRGAELRELPGATSLMAPFRRLTRDADGIPPIRNRASSRLQLLLVSSETIPRDRTALAARAKEFDALSRNEPGLQILWLLNDRERFELIWPDRLAAALRHKIARLDAADGAPRAMTPALQATPPQEDKASPDPQRLSDAIPAPEPEADPEADEHEPGPGF